MDLPDNVIRHFLRNVYFISGNSCGGKSTISEYLSKKHDIALYDWDGRFPKHKEISDPLYQPAMNKEHKTWEQYFSRPPKEYSDWLKKSIKEQVEIAVLDLVRMAKDQKVVVDGIFPCDILRDISSPDRVVFLMAEIEVIREVYFDRSDRKEMLDCLKKLDNSTELIENVFKALEYTLDDDMKDVKKSGFKYFIIGELNPDWEGIMHDIEKHFGFITSY